MGSPSKKRPPDPAAGDQTSPLSAAARAAPPAVSAPAPARASTRGPILGRVRAEDVLDASRRLGEPRWLGALRAAWLDAYRKEGLPSPMDEAWRGTNLRGLGILNLPVALLDEGENRPEAARLEVGKRPEGGKNGEGGDSREAGVLFSNLERAALRHPDRVRPFMAKPDASESVPPLAALNRALMGGGALLHLSEGVEAGEPFRVTHAAGSRGGAVFPRTLVSLEAGSRAVLIESYSGPEDGSPGFSNALTEVRVGEGAVLDLLTLIRPGGSLACCNRAVARVAGGGSLRWYFGTVGGVFCRVDVEVFLDGPGGSSHIVGIAAGMNRDFLDHRTVQHHVSGETTSRIHFGTLLRGEAASIYRGMIRMEQGAFKSDAYQKNDNLMLEAGPSAKAIPVLEILADDVKCSHGSTVGRLSDEHLFYLASRGIPVASARRLIAEGFIRRQLTSAGDWNPLSEEILGAVRHRILEA